MKKITSITILTTAEGKRISVTYSEINAYGKIISENNKENRVIVDKSVLTSVEDLENFALDILGE